MSIDYQQENGAGTAGTIQACSTSAATATTQTNRLASAGGAAGSTAQTLTMPGSAANRRAVYFEIVPSSTTSWDAGTWICRWRVSTANTNLVLRRIEICRLNSSNVSQQMIGTLDVSLGTLSAGARSDSVTGAAATPAAGDKVYIIYQFDNTGSSMTQSAGWTPDQIITAPFSLITARAESVRVVSQALHRSASY